MTSRPCAYTVRVAAIEAATSRTRRFELVSDGAQLPPFEAGSHIEIMSGDGVPRSNSITNHLAERDMVTLTGFPGWRGDGVVE